jgi:hypothetical protein
MIHIEIHWSRLWAAITSSATDDEPDERIASFEGTLSQWVVTGGLVIGVIWAMVMAVSGALSS